MNQMFLICDESGAKGYSSNHESFIGEIGIMAGCLVADEQLAEVLVALDGIGTKYLGQGKLHITDLSPAQQECLRAEVFDYLRENAVPCMYEAIYVEGFHTWFASQIELLEQARLGRQSAIKVSGNFTQESLHVHLFQGLLGKAVAYCLDNVGERINLVVVADQIDPSVVKDATNAINELLAADQPSESKVTGFDPITKRVVKATVQIKVKTPAEALLDLSGISVTIQCETSGLTLAADVLANSINHHFRTRPQEQKMTALNDAQAIQGHPLKSVMSGIWNGEGLYASDALFKHPGSTRSG